jgi:2-oxoisovalerate dehydrogenase E1 component alpha subunit
MIKVASFEIHYSQYLDASGKAVAELPEFARDPAALIPLYRAMVMTRRFDAKAIALQRTGRLGTYASSLGQEAVTVGLAAAMRPEDVLLPTYREAGAQLWRGVTLDELLLYWGGDERGSDFAGPRGDFPIAVPVASQCLHAVGVAYAKMLQKEPGAAVCVCGDGATSNGAFYEAINCAGVWRVPAVFVINNNQWAISMPRSAQALARGRAGEGPSVVEALTYRLTDHTTADDAGRYRDAEAVSAQWAKDPIARLRNHLSAASAWTKKAEEELIDELNAEIDAAVERYLAIPPEPPESMFDHLYAQLPAAYTEQRIAASRGGDHG